MNIWRILGIEPTKDIAQIKAAYAKRAKEWHPEEHPEEFQRLRTAYKQALQYAKTGTVVKRYDEDVVFASKSLRKEASSPKSPVKETPLPKGPEKEDEQPKQPAVKAEEEFDYQYVGIGDKKRRLLSEFKWIALNPYLMNSVKAWECYLKRDQWKELLQEREFTEQLCEIILNLDGWKRSTLLFLKNKIREYGGIIDGYDWKKLELESVCRRIFGPAGIITVEDGIMQKILLDQLKNRGLPYGLELAKSIDAYIPIYLTYAETAEEQLEKRYRERCQKGNENVVIWKIVVLFVAAFLVTGIFSLGDPKEEKPSNERVTTEELVQSFQEMIESQAEANTGYEVVEEDTEELLEQVLALWENADKTENQALLDNNAYLTVTQTEDEYGNCVTFLAVRRVDENRTLIKENIYLFELQDAESYLQYSWQGTIQLDPMTLLNVAKNGVHCYLERAEGEKLNGKLLTRKEFNEWLKANILE